MTHQAAESSLEAGRPVRFYQFVLGSITWRYTSSDEKITIGGHEWIPAAITDDGSRQINEPISDAMSIEGPQWIGPSQVYLSSGPAKTIVVTVFETHVDDVDEELVVEYIGEVTQVNHPMPGRCRITCETIEASMDREGLRHSWQRLCPYTVYDPLTCRLDKATFEQAVVVLDIADMMVTLEISGTSRPNGWFQNGFIQWDHPVRGTEFLPIEEHKGNIVYLLTDPGDLYVGATGSIYPGCSFTPESCTALGNYPNFGGHQDMTGKSPFDGTPVF